MYARRRSDCSNISSKFRVVFKVTIYDFSFDLVYSLAILKGFPVKSLLRGPYILKCVGNVGGI
jgi:hypothetical protein